MAFDPLAHKVVDWISLDDNGKLIKFARTFNSENLVANEYKTLNGTVTGSPSLFIEYIYDARGNILAENKEVREWTSAQENIADEPSAEVIDSSADEVTAKSQTQYSTTTTNVQYWLGLETDGQLTKINVGTATSTKQIFHYALPSVVVGGECLQRINHINSSVITGYVDILGTWTQAMQDIAAPAISDITLSALITVEDQLVGENIGTLATAGSNQGHGTVTWTLTSTTLTGDKLRIGTGADVDKLEVGPNAIGPDDDGSYNAVIKGTDELGGYREETFSITISDNDITVVEFDNDTTAANVKYGDAADTLIDILQSTGGVGAITFSITDYDALGSSDMTNIRIDGTRLEIGPSTMNTAVGAHTIEITATDSNPWPLSDPLVQTKTQNFVITVLSTAITNVTLSANETYNNSTDDYFIGNLAAVVNNGGQGPWTFAFGADPSSKLNNVRIDGVKLEVDTSGIDQSPGSYNVNIIATDSVGQVSSTITIAVTILSAFTNLKALDLNATGVDPDFKSNYLQETSGLFNTHLTATTPFSFSTWFKTNTDPVTTTVVPYQSTASYSQTYASNPYYMTPQLLKMEEDLQNTTNFNMDFNSAAGHTVSFWYRRRDNSTINTYADDTLWMWNQTSENNRYVHHMYEGTTQYTLYWKSSWIINVHWDYDDSDLLDFNWHHIAFTYEGGTAFDAYGTGTDAFKLYIDGDLITQASASITSGGVGAPNGVTHKGREDAPDEFFGLFDYIQNRRNEAYFSDATIWNKDLSSVEITEIYNSGQVVNILGLSFFSTALCAAWWKLGADDDDNAGAIDLVGDNGTDAAGIKLPYEQGVNGFDDYSGNGNHLTHWVRAERSAGGIYVGDIDEAVYPASAPSYVTTTSAPVIFRNGGKSGSDIGEGITVSITDRYSDAGAYVAGGGEDPKVAVSFDGFETDATKVLVYDTDVTDNNWKNLVVVYDSSLTDNKDRISVYLNGAELTPLGSPVITFTGNNNYFKNVSDTASNTTIGATGIVETAGANGIHTLQAVVDSISLHSEALSSAMITELYNSGVPINVLDTALASDHTKVEMWVNFEDAADDASTAQDETSNNKDITLVNMVTGDYLTLSGADSIYYNP